MPTQVEIQWITPPSAKPIRMPNSRSIKIGRDEGNHLHLPDSTVSRHHATFEPTAQGWRLIDHDSTNGVYVNGSKRKDVLLKSDDIVRIGGYSFRLIEAASLDVRELSFNLESTSITVGLGLDLGTKRQPPNQDNIGSFKDIEIATDQLEDKGYLFVVSDGMGGHKGGEVASEIVVNKTLTDYYEGDEPRISEKQIKTALDHSIQKANKEVHDSGEGDESLADMGATLVSAVVTKDRVVIASVGDSRAYRLRDNSLEQLTIDQTMAQELYARGALSTHEFKNSPLHHTLIQAMGRNEALDINFTSKSLRPGDVILLCSDGLSNVVADSDIIAILSDYKGESAAQKLIEQANANGGPDNISVVVMHVPAK